MSGISLSSSVDDSMLDKVYPSRGNRNYQLSKIYVITNNVNKMKYVGTTTDNDIRRDLINFKEQADHDIYNHFKLIEDMRTFEKDKFTIELLEDFPCSTPRELQKRENEWIKKLETDKDKIGYN